MRKKPRIKKAPMPIKKTEKPNAKRVRKTRERLRKVISIFDAHVPHHIDLKGFIEFLKDEAPTHFVIGGDFLNMDSLSHWDLAGGKRKKLEGKRFSKDMKAGNDVLDQLQEVLPKGCEVIFLEGNHCNWAEQYADRNPEMEGVVSIPKCLNLEDRGIKWITFKSSENFYKIGDLVYTHGGEATGQWHAKKMASIFNSSQVRYGHRHSEQTWTTPVKNALSPKVQAKCIPAMCNDGDYMGGKADAWRRGFHIAYVKANGKFFEYIIPIINGQFHFNNKTYGKKPKKKV